MNDDALAQIRHRHNRRTSTGIWYERDRDIASLLAVVDALVGQRDRLVAECAELGQECAMRRLEMSRWPEPSPVALLVGEVERDRLLGFRDAWYRKVYGED